MEKNVVDIMPKIFTEVNTVKKVVKDIYCP